jgi:hypothetical protein
MLMQSYEVSKNPDALSAITLNRTIAPVQNGTSDDAMVIDKDTGEVIAVQVVMPELRSEGRELARMLRYAKLPWTDPNGTLTKNERLSGMGANTIAVGYTAPNKMYKRYAAKLAPVHFDAIPTGNLLLSIAQPMWKRFQEILPAEASAHQSMTEEQIHPDWFLNQTPFTSGVVNNSAVLPYHKDAGNIKGAWSMMLCLRSKMKGGGLHLLEYDTTFAIPDLSVLFFCGQKTIHGVTPFIQRSKEAYRFTVVYYTKTALRDCGSAAEETLRAQLSATERAFK